MYLKTPWVFPCAQRTVDLVPRNPVCHLCILHFLPPCTQGKVQDTSVTGPAWGLHMPKTVTYRWLFPNWTLARTRHHTATPSCNLKVIYKVRTESYTIHNSFLLSRLCPPGGRTKWRTAFPMKIFFLPHDELFRENRDSQTGKRAHKTLRVWSMWRGCLCSRSNQQEREWPPEIMVLLWAWRF